jgi:hypothetical protein
MKVFLLDLWLDLRAKRLAPVAVLLLAAVIAVPIVLANGKKSPPAPAAPGTATTASVAPVVQSAPQAGAVSSKLQDFSSRDPFAPTGHAATTTATSTPSGGAPTGTSTTPAGTGQTGGGTTGSTGTTGPTGTGPTGTTVPKTTFFTFTVDIRFGPPGDQKLHKGVQRLELIPDAQDPKIVFLGVTSTEKTAVFLVDSSLGVDTNGKCKPSGDQCTFLYLRPDGTHDQAELTDQDGNTFRLHLLNIHRVVVGASTGSGNSGSNKSGSSNRSPAFTGRAGSSQNETATGDSPPGEPSQPFTFQGSFADAGQ